MKVHSKKILLQYTQRSINNAFSSTGPSIVTTHRVFPKKQTSDMSGQSTFKQKPRQTPSDARVQRLIGLPEKHIESV